MRSIEQAVRAWRDNGGLQGAQQHHKAAGSSEATHIPDGLRSLYWKYYLLRDPSSTSDFQLRLQDLRGDYDFDRNRYLYALQHVDEVDPSADPLSEGGNSPWELLRKDDALRREIFQDVERCMPDNTYFMQPATQTMLLDILFIWAKKNPGIGYRQGMHELAAPVLWVVERDAIEQASATGEPYDQNEDVRDMFDEQHIEHDTFSLFNAIMEVTKSSFDHQSTNGGIEKQGDTPIIGRCHRILEDYVARTDSSLAKHLADIDIVPQVFLLRWIRLLFGREMSLDHTLALWDQMFVKDFSMDCIDLVCVVIILHDRWELIDSDYNTATRRLMGKTKVVTADDVTALVEDALFLKTHLAPEGGQHVIAKRTGRAPPILDRPSTPARTTEPTISSSETGLASPPHRSNRISQLPAGLEGLLENASREVYTRGERWGLNQAVRDVVVEVKKNVQQVQTRTQSRMHSRNPSAGMNDTQNSPQNRLDNLEARNKALAKMLDGAVSTLWDEQKNAGEISAQQEDRAKSVTAAIAKVQFVQVYLTDPSLALPLEQEAPTVGGVAEPSPPQVGREENHMPNDRETQAEVMSRDAQPPDAKPAEGAPAERSPVSKTRKPAGPTRSSSKMMRPPLEQSSFSWMLGQEEAPASSSARKTFMSAAPFKEGSFRGKSASRSSTAFLFGDEGNDPFAKEDRGSKAKPKDKDARNTDTDEKDFRLGTLKGKPPEG